MPLDVVCLVPAAPLLLPRLTGGDVPEVAAVRAAVAVATAALTGLDEVVVVAEHVPGTLAGFGAPVRDGGSAPADAAPASGVGRGRPASWPHELADALLDAAGARGVRRHLGWDEAPADLPARLEASDRHVGLLLLADGSRTRGPRAPGGDDPRGEAVDVELAAALREGRPARTRDDVAVGATAAPAVALLAAAPGGPTTVLHDGAPLGVCYLVAVRRRGTT